MLCLLLLMGCSRENTELDRAMALRTSLLNGKGCSFDGQITADFGDKTYVFLLKYEADEKGNVDFIVLEPENIKEITGTIQGEGGMLRFDDKALAFPLLADGVLSPISGGWILLRALRSGYVRHCTAEGDLLRVTVDDSYEQDALTLDVWLNENNSPVQADLYEENRRIMTITLQNFQIK